jgi:hypothetical protein
MSIAKLYIGYGLQMILQTTIAIEACHILIVVALWGVIKWKWK